MIKSIFRHTVNKFYDLPLSTKFFLSYFLVTIIPLVIFGYILYGSIYASEQKKMEYSASQSFQQALSVVNSRTRYVNNIISLLLMDETLQRIADTRNEQYLNDVGQQLIDSDKLFKLINSVEKREGILKFKLYIDNDKVLSKENSTFFNIDQIRDKEWYKLLLKNRHKNLWCRPDYFSYEGGEAGDRIPVVRIAKDLNDFDKDAGVIRLDLSAAEIRDILVKAKVSEHTAVFILNGRNERICSSEENGKMNDSLLRGLMNMEYPEDAREPQWKKANLEGKENLVSISGIEGTDWRMIMSVPYSDIFASSKNLRYKVLIMVFAIMVVAYITAFLISITNTRRLKAFIKLMQHAEKGDFNAQALPAHNDEIGELSRNFNTMLTKIAMLIDEQFELGKKVKNAELKALQAQINPHFLYNTLDLINWFSLMGKDEELREVVISLSKFYKLSLNKGEEETKLESELEHVKSYMHIQNKRFKDKLEFEVDIEEELYDCRILKITLQPIVENAIIHGIMEKKTKEGKISVRAIKEGEDIRITVTDNGLGMDPSRLEEIRRGNYESKGSSYGLKNIRERLTTLYGEQYGLTFDSVKGSGTSVEIVIPRIKK